MLALLLSACQTPGLARAEHARAKFSAAWVFTNAQENQFDIGDGSDYTIYYALHQQETNKYRGDPENSLRLRLNAWVHDLRRIYKSRDKIDMIVNLEIERLIDQYGANSEILEGKDLFDPNTSELTRLARWLNSPAEKRWPWKSISGWDLRRSVSHQVQIPWYRKVLKHDGVDSRFDNNLYGACPTGVPARLEAAGRK